MTNEKIELKDVVNFFEYEKVRDAMRARIIELKRRRRVSVGSHLSLVFENRDTLLFQIQEMCRVERITDDARVQDELDVYNALLPRPGELSATLFIEITEKDQIQLSSSTASWASTWDPPCGSRSAGSSPSPASSRPAIPTRRRASSPPCTSSASPSRPRLRGGPCPPRGRPSGRARPRGAARGNEGRAAPRSPRLRHEGRMGFDPIRPAGACRGGYLPSTMKTR